MGNKLFDSFFNNTIEGIMLIDEGFIVDINSSMLEILEYSSKNELINKLATGILIPNNNQKYLQYNKEIYEEVSLITKNGNIIPAIIKIKDYSDEKRDYKLVFILNLTELKQKETLLIEQSRMAAMGEMISMIAHQWRQPLSSIAVAISNLKFRTQIGKIDDENLVVKLDDMNKYVQYMSNTIEDFKNFFKGDKEKELIHIYDVTDMALEMLKNSFSKIKINHNKENINNIYIYKNELLQVILNILNNSKDAFNENKILEQIIDISYNENDNEQIITIKDNAGGINQNIIDRVFDPYYSTKDSKNGTGLGLYMCKIIIEKHFNGNITIESNNQETTLIITINKYI